MSIRDSHLGLKTRLVEYFVFLVLLYGVEAWVKTLTKSFEMWICRRISPIFWRGQITNEEVLHRMHKEKQKRKLELPSFAMLWYINSPGYCKGRERLIAEKSLGEDDILCFMIYDSGLYWHLSNRSEAQRTKSGISAAGQRRELIEHTKKNNYRNSPIKFR